MKDNRIIIKGYIEEIFDPFFGEKNVIIKFRIRHLHLGIDDRENGDQTIFEIAAYNNKCDLLDNYKKNMKVEVIARLFSWKQQTEKFNGMNLQLRLSEIKLAAGNIIPL